MELTSRDNPLVKECVKLLSDAKYRRRAGKFVVEGARLCADAAVSGVTVEAALVTASAKSRYAAQWQAVEAVAAKVYDMSDTLARSLSDTGSPQGMICLCAVSEEAPINVRPDGVYVALEDVQDPGNLGTIIRTAEAFGVDGLILSRGCCDVYNPKVLRASMGGVFRMKMTVAADFCGELQALSATLPVLACVVDRDAEKLTSLRISGAVAVIGNEGNGMSAEAIAVCDRRITIPMAGRAESLNASMAAGILMWELCRPRVQEGDA